MTNAYTDLYKQQCQNVKSIEDGYKSLEKNVKIAIKTRSAKDEFVCTKLLSNLTLIWMEACVLKICYDNNAFTDKDIIIVRKAKSLKQRIISLINMAFCKKYNLPFTRSKRKLKPQIPPTNRFRYENIINLIEDDFKESVKILNKISIGQWKYAYEKEKNILDKKLTDKIHKENIIHIQLNRSLFNLLMELIQNIAVDFSKFEEKFDIIYDKIEKYKLNKEARDYQAYRDALITRHEAGKVKKERPITVN
ncbi:hypothetical protein NLI92_002841 [Priestia megaterium]|uniref:hypothetical protein n=1 Tax=Priestia megaterium TaxID=1404 RepID=UPI0021ACDAC9|nr:hypothetical protein [Priestia megaterium]MCR8927457.1 hypothetical protein [Priestia megaterium]